MGLPDPNSARTWGGRLLVDRDGAEIGICREIFVDDATGKPEWATADVAGGPAFIPLVDAVESGPGVRVIVRGVDVAGAPSVGDVRHLSEDEEERLYRHYGIDYSRAASDSGLPAEAPAAAPTPVPAVSSTSSASPDSTTTPAEGPAGEQASPQQAADEIEAAETASWEPPRARPIRLLALGLLAALGAIAGAVLRSRRRAQPPATRAERLAARARSASLGLDTRRRQALASAAPALQTGRRLSVVAAQQAALQAAAAAEQASALAARAKAMPLARASRTDDVVEPPPTIAANGTPRRVRALGAVKTAAGFGAGYLLGSRVGQARVEQVRQATATWAQRPAVQQARSRLGTGVTETLHAGNARLSQSTAHVAGRLRRRPTGDDGSVAGGSGDAASANGARGGSGDDL
jgi:hypothetical protein